MRQIPDFIREQFEREQRAQATREGYAEYEAVLRHYNVYAGANPPDVAFRLAYEAALEEARKERVA